MLASEQLYGALGIMRTHGWAKHYFVSDEGHCALGAVRDAAPDGIKDYSHGNLKKLSLHGCTYNANVETHYRHYQADGPR